MCGFRVENEWMPGKRTEQVADSRTAVYVAARILSCFAESLVVNHTH